MTDIVRLSKWDQSSNPRLKILFKVRKSFLLYHIRKTSHCWIYWFHFSFQYHSLYLISFYLPGMFILFKDFAAQMFTELTRSDLIDLKWLINFNLKKIKSIKSDCHNNRLILPPPPTDINFTLLFLSPLWSNVSMWGHFWKLHNLRNSILRSAHKNSMHIFSKLVSTKYMVMKSWVSLQDCCALSRNRVWGDWWDITKYVY